MANVRRVRRIVRKIDPWTVLKTSFVVNMTLAVAIVLGFVIFWSVLVKAGIPQKINALVAEIEFSPQLIKGGDEYFRVVIFGALVFAILATGFFTLSAVLYNLVADVVGGVEVVVLEETLNVPASAAVVRAPQRWSAASVGGGNGSGNGSNENPTRETAAITVTE